MRFYYESGTQCILNPFRSLRAAKAVVTSGYGSAQAGLNNRMLRPEMDEGEGARSQNLAQNTILYLN